MLTKRQGLTYDFIAHFNKLYGYSPSLDEIRQRFELTSVSTAHFLVSKLVEKGYVYRDVNQARGIFLKNNFPQVLSSNFPIENFINKVFQADCLDVLPTLPDKSIDFILCDLPYGTTQNQWDSVIPLDRLWAQYERIVKDRGVIALTGQGMFTAQLMLSNPKMFKYKIIWIKSKPTNFLNAKKQPLRRHEDICIFYKQQPVYHPQMSVGEPYNKGFRKNQLTGSYGNFATVEVKSNGERYPTDVIYFKTAESEGRVFHPTQKPVELGRYLVRTFTNQEDIVLDNACGSGSFLVAAACENRKYIGIEKNQEAYLHRKDKTDYIAVCQERLGQIKTN